MKGLTADENVKIVTALIVSDEIYHKYVDPATCSVYWNFCICLLYTSLSGIHAYYEPEELVGKTLIAITNLPPRAMMGIESCGMLLLSLIHIFQPSSGSMMSCWSTGTNQ